MEPLIDAHLHLDLLPDPRRALADLVAAGHQAIAVTNAPSVFEWTERLVAATTCVQAALGLHPELASERERELPLMWKLLPKTRFIGEVGLDYVTSDRGERAAQRRVFESVVERCDAVGDKVLTIHSRRAAADVTAVLKGFRGTAILHWFSGTIAQLKRASDAGCFFSINPSMTTSKRGRDLVQRMRPEQVLTESDAPFASINGREVNIADIARLADLLAESWQCDPREARCRLLRNFNQALTPAVEIRK